MATVNGASLRGEGGVAKARIAAPPPDGKVPGKPAAG